MALPPPGNGDPRGGGGGGGTLTCLRGRAIISGYLFFLKSGNYRYQFFKYVRNYGYHLKKHAKLLGGRFGIGGINVQLEIKV